MAIIYTYPKLTNPQGNELIVVSDVNNKNATRLITIADIASLVPGGGGGGCTSAISGILTGAGSYIPPLCNEVTFTGSGINISADQATATVTFTVSCATTNQIGGIKAYPTQTESGDWPQPSEEGTYYPLEAVTFLEAGPNATCMGAVKIPDSQSYVLPCATNSTLGGIKAQTNNSETSVPDKAESGTYYPVELMKNPSVTPENANCTAIVRVPSGGDSYVLPCATPTALGGIKASKAEGIEVPQPADSGSYYPVQTTSSENDDDCTAVVRIPDPETPATPGNGQITIAAGTGLTGGGSFTVNQAGPQTITLNATGGSGSGSNGFTPMSIYDSDNIIPQNVVSIFVQTVVEDTCQINKVDFASYGAAAPNDTVVGLYRGTLADAGNTVYLGGGTLSGAVAGEFIYTIDLIPQGGSLGDTINITAGDDIVIFYSRAATTGFHIGKGQVNGFSNDAIAQKVTGTQITQPDLNDNIQAILAETAGDVTNAQVPRLACHFYYEEYTPPADERRTYSRCEDAVCDGWTLGDIIVIEAAPSLLLDYLILEDVETKAVCCFVKGDITTDDVTPGVTIDNTFTDCENLPEVCAEGDDDNTGGGDNSGGDVVEEKG